jgi:hypothetical protein
MGLGSSRMNAIRFRKHIDSETLVLPEIRAMLGKNVEIIVLDDDAPNAVNRGFQASAGKYPDFDEDAFLALREASKI